ncbi:16S rRNA (cytidine(1402)-2'-O)-methyltransferase [Actinomycetospora termitidis]|uniref:Ribosomal RNA small subunit methyltransferase I n=1 Tax=Actinomycetospora termitidis TaxID=3053470 RepID=A0ABT7MHY5_9PSEU|nr:16S rRNA (cytidine(1402)-2'-O)-methyltransferase [Actinomycetospora sp. Odt1-22]MDL5160298.1 16S rRNA (cytidine(1402)-2'-O)-methyltransferase [Actinomycetospora sp. Odt1-22]
MTDGVLLLAATPLGNPDDASQRLREALATADVVAVEDTRRLGRLTSALGVTVTGRKVSFYEDVERTRTPRLVEELEGGATVLVVTDAGMPSVSDPGYRLVDAAIDAGITVRCLPGPSAVLAALAVSGLPTDRFCFEGFPPRTDHKRDEWFSELAHEPRTVVFFESPRRLGKTLRIAAEVLGADRRVAVCRELTKTHEEVLRGTLGELAAWAEPEGTVLGEITVVLGPAVRKAPDPDELAEEVLALVEGGRGLKDAAKEVGTAHGVPTNALYESALKLRG